MQEVFNRIIEQLKEWTFNADINIGDGTIMNHNLIASKNAIEIVKQEAAEYEKEHEQSQGDMTRDFALWLDKKYDTRMYSDSYQEYLDDKESCSQQNPLCRLSDEVKDAMCHLMYSFRGSKLLTDREPVEFLCEENSNTYFILGNCKTKLDVDCKVLEWVSRAACKTTPYQREVSNENFHRQMLAGINAYLGTSFSREDIELIYTRLGNACNHEKTVEFVKSGFDFSILNPDMAKQERREYVKTNVGFIPLEDYYDICARKNGFEDYEDMRDNGYSIDKPETTTLLSEELDMDGYLNM